MMPLCVRLLVMQTHNLLNIHAATNTEIPQVMRFPKKVCFIGIFKNRSSKFVLGSVRVLGQSSHSDCDQVGHDAYQALIASTHYFLMQQR